ncbi:MAG: hypothetical protein R3E79_18295 [Caldilineaceae bacterium]
MQKPFLFHWGVALGTALALVGCVIPPPSHTLQTINTNMIAPTAQSSAAASNDKLTTAQRQLLATLPALGTAPELQNEIWLNSAPLQLAALRGKVVMVEFWTYG